VEELSNSGKICVCRRLEYTRERSSMPSATSLAIKLADRCRPILTVIMPMYVNVRKNPFLALGTYCISIVSKF
jgi:hypothetical protein